VKEDIVSRKINGSISFANAREFLLPQLVQGVPVVEPLSAENSDSM